MMRTLRSAWLPIIVLLLVSACGSPPRPGDGGDARSGDVVNILDGQTDGSMDGTTDAPIRCTPDCVSGQECVNGVCVCNANSCPGCCNGNNCVEVSAESNAMCGRGGLACAACTGGTPTCTSGACTDTCGSAGNGTCTTGCCTGGHCTDGSAATGCGTTGGSCVDCTTSAIGRSCVTGRCGCNADSDCPSGQACNTTTHECACGPSSCTGCCDPASGACVTASASSCGSNGSSCAACAAGQTCSGGACHCDPATCNGCCSGDTCIPLTAETATSCGAAGAMCAACGAGQACDATGACVCNATSCPTGCCAGNVCVDTAGQSATSCGTGGAACAGCATGQSCVGGSCVCDATSCPTGCCNGNTCVAAGSQTDTQCGTGGAACGGCATGQACQGGACVCNAASCPNGCCNGNTCVPYATQDGTSCGTGGAACGACSAGQACLMGSCGCGAASCAGCCASGSCIGLASETNGQCGTSGVACAACGGLTPTCSAGACTGACSATTPCMGGCCSGAGTCAAGTSATACGSPGGACVDCSTNMTGHACLATGTCGCATNADCPSGLTCNPSSGTCGACNATTCPTGCCDAMGICRTTMSGTTCGTGGRACAACGAGQTCSAGACVCDATSCAGCCNGSSCVPIGSQNGSQCGAGGAMCGGCIGNASGSACVGGACGCASAADCPSGSVCNSTTGRCVAGGACSLGPCAGCCDGTGTCRGGTAASACGAAGGACVDCGATTPTCRTGATCTAGACTYSNAPTGTTCGTDFCMPGQTCDASGNCTGGAPRDCTMGNACLTCTCSSSAGMCNCASRSPNAGSTLTVTSTCLTTNTGAQLAVVMHLVDGAGAPLTGATVTFNTTTPVTWVEPAVVEVPNPPGTYYRTMRAPTATGTTRVTANVTACGSTVTLASSPTVNFVAAAPATGASGAFQGVAGCTAVAGHVRVRVIAEETGAPISGASVMIGSAQGTPYVGSAAALFPNPTPASSNVGTTNAMGYVEFLDFGSMGGLQGPQIITAAAATRANKTYYNFNGADNVIALPLRRPARTTYAFTNGTASPIPARPDCTWAQAGVTAQDTNIEALSGFSVSTLLSPNKCVNAGAIAGNLSMPGNLYLPMQTLSTTILFCSAANLNSPWTLNVDAGARVLTMPFVRIPASAAMGGDFVAMLQQATWQSIGYQTRTVSAAVSGDNITLGDTYSANVVYTYMNQPANTDVTGLTLLDFDGGNGIGRVGLTGVQIHRYNTTGSTVTVPVGRTTTAPAGTRHFGGVVAGYLNPLGTRTPAADVSSSISMVFVRQNAAGAQPFGETSNTSLTVNNFLGLTPAVVDATGTVYTFGDAANAGQVPQYTVSTLGIQHSVFEPQQACETTPSKTTVTYPQWIVVRPRATGATTCSSLMTASATCEGFALPTLPSSFPQATTGTQQQSGFEQYVGSGNACTTMCPVAGEFCHVPDGTTLPAEYMGQVGTRYFTERYGWQIENRVLGLAPTAVSAGAADFTAWRGGLTQVSYNTVTR